MKYLTTLLFLVIGVFFIPIIVDLESNASGGIDILNYDEDLDLTLDDYTIGSTTRLESGSVNTIEFCSQNVYAVVGDGGVPYLSVYKKIDGDYVLQTENIPVVSSSVNSLSISNDSKRLVVGLAGSADRIEVFENNNDVWTKEETGVAVYSNTAVQAVEFFGTNSQYLATGVVTAGGSDDEIKIYKYDSVANDYTIIYSLDFGTVYDFDSVDNYLIFSTEISPFLYAYEMNETNDTLTRLILTDTPNVLVTDISFSDNGSFISTTVTDGVPHVFSFDNVDTTEMVLNNIPVGFTNLQSTQFAGNKYVYFSDIDTDIMKFEYNSNTLEWDNIVNDIPPVTVRLRQIDFAGDYEFLFIGDNSGLDIYDLDTTFIADPINLPVEATGVDSVLQNSILKDYTLVGNQLTIIDPTGNVATINYEVDATNEYADLIGIIPIVAIVAIIAGSVFYIKFK